MPRCVYATRPVRYPYVCACTCSCPRTCEYMCTTSFRILSTWPAAPRAHPNGKCVSPYALGHSQRRAVGKTPCFGHSTSTLQSTGTRLSVLPAPYRGKCALEKMEQGKGSCLRSPCVDFMISSRPLSSALNLNRGSTADWENLRTSLLSGPSFTAPARETG